MGSPDSEMIRQHLLELLGEIEESPAVEYPIGDYRDEVVVGQLGEFCEGRAISDLERIASFDPEETTGEPFHRTRVSLVAVAREALRKIEGDEGGE